MIVERAASTCYLSYLSIWIQIIILGWGPGGLKISHHSVEWWEMIWGYKWKSFQEGGTRRQGHHLKDLDPCQTYLVRITVEGQMIKDFKVTSHISDQLWTTIFDQLNVRWVLTTLQILVRKQFWRMRKIHTFWQLQVGDIQLWNI